MSAALSLSGQSTEGKLPRAGRFTRWAYHLHHTLLTTGNYQ